MALSNYVYSKGNLFSSFKKFYENNHLLQQHYITCIKAPRIKEMRNG